MPNQSKAILGLFFFITLTVTLASFVIVPALAGNPMYFNVTLTISDVAPNVTVIQPQTVTPVEGVPKTIWLVFNATSQNGNGNIPATNATVIINRSSTTHTSSSCAILSSGPLENTYNCTLSINYYDTPGTWTINASVVDASGLFGTNTSNGLTINSLSAINLKTTSISFSGTPGQSGVAASNNPQVVNNTGNTAFTSLNLTAFTIISGSNTIGAGNFTANTSNSVIGLQLANGTSLNVASSNISIQGTQNLYLSVNIPNGLANGSYNSPTSWIVTGN